MFQLGPYTYSSKEELKGELKASLQTASDGLISNSILIKKLHYLILLHPHAKEKIGFGIEQFIIERNHYGSGKSFMIVRADGTKERFSYNKCIEGQTVTSKSQAIEALRFSVRAQVMEFRKSVKLPTLCALSGEPILTNEELHIDHKTPFWLIVQRFYQTRILDLGSLETTGNGENLQLVDRDVEKQFQEFHRLHAELQPTLKANNLGKGGIINPNPAINWTAHKQVSGYCKR